VSASKDEDSAALRKLDALEEQVRHLAARTPAVVQVAAGAVRLTADDRRTLRAVLAAADPERREATILSLVRAMNEQRLRPTEPGPPF
jgi:hypothetical protein